MQDNIMTLINTMTQSPTDIGDNPTSQSQAIMGDNAMTQSQTQPSTTIPPIPTHSKHQRSSSPSNSPHKVGKLGPKQRMRTVVPRDLTKSIIDSSLEKALVESHSTANNLQPVTTLIFDDFLKNDIERKQEETFKENMLMYTFQKCSIHQHNETIILRDMRYFLNSSFPIQLQASQVHYIG